jgi:hypothetical protein
MFNSTLFKSFCQEYLHLWLLWLLVTANKIPKKSLPVVNSQFLTTFKSRHGNWRYCHGIFRTRILYHLLKDYLVFQKADAGISVQVTAVLIEDPQHAWKTAANHFLSGAQLILGVIILRNSSLETSQISKIQVCTIGNQKGLNMKQHVLLKMVDFSKPVN